MIPRYSRKEISGIWEPKNKFKIWLKIEILICEALNKLGKVPTKSLNVIKEKAKFNEKRIDEIEKEVKHDVIAFLTNLSENIGEDSRFIHQGVTSSDILDTTLSIQLKESCLIIKKELEKLLEVLKEKAISYKKIPCIGRSHGIYAEPTTFGLKMLSKYFEFKRSYERFLDAEKSISVCAISGAVGTFANIDPFVQDYVAKKLNIRSEDVSTQVIPRDRYAYLFSVIAIIASSLENLAIEIRHLQRSEVREVQEFFSNKQKGSSAMPHKKNPVLSENITGIARIIRANILPILENVSLWHERDISHSSVERVIFPDTLVLLDFALNRMSEVVKNLIINKKNMLDNLNNTNGLYNSQRVLLKLIEKGITREDAYKKVQKIAMDSWNKNKSFKDLLKKNKGIKDFLSSKEIDKIFKLEYHFKNINYIFKKIDK
ncbi:MAG: adenylosuccinate lyase [Pelagibacteraceae bacterium TMED124]|nr:adenylosuccinate lyase [Rickettsiales bacterium]RPG16347.1 MAG: adenylosuccinate lyase [Pelagibacteraceae bacterium TMED124]|tara:strand:- start:1689 stop:2981 length:1293 start_codon:yes stop_codon:yes gene_type:complete